MDCCTGLLHFTGVFSLLNWRRCVKEKEEIPWKMRKKLQKLDLRNENKEEIKENVLEGKSHGR